ncbi:mimecan [Tachyglossus aculeatus]|uniref:mimecan n=1 Tax=Tachyglossus aculeatus TaxID=9261 RepID=UPI0018F50CD1|nr:mimecan [Tachyglossus aculeatus]
MKILQATLLLLTFVLLVKSAPPTQQKSFSVYDHGADIYEEKLSKQDYEDKILDEAKTQGKRIANAAQEKNFQLQKDESVTGRPPKKEDSDIEMPTCLLCVCITGSVYCEETDIDTVPALPKETAYLYARFNKIKKLKAKDFADIPTLKRLDFTGNLIEDIEDATFSKLALLEELSLAENNLIKLPLLPPKLTLFNAKFNKLKSRGIKANIFKKLNNLSYLYLDHNALESVPANLPESLRVIHLQYNNITSITDDTFCKSNDTRYIRNRIDEIRMEGNPIILGKHPNSFICLKILPVGTYY